GAQDVGVRQREVVALNGDVEVVLQRQGDGIVERKVQLAVAQQALDAIAVGKIPRGHADARLPEQGLVQRTPHREIDARGILVNAVVLRRDRKRGSQQEGKGQEQRGRQ